jgi:peptide-methionine (R)-S-oxide reductase
MPAGIGCHSYYVLEQCRDAKIQPDYWVKTFHNDKYWSAHPKDKREPFSVDGKMSDDHNEYHDNKRKGKYYCAGCGNELFTSDTKYDSGTGWPSFFAPISEDKVEFHDDKTFRAVRTEVACARCGGHLGHVFDDGPGPTGKRYCMNSGSLRFVDEK